MLSDNDRIGHRGLFFLVSAIIIEIGILNAPRIFAEAVGSDAWIVVILNYIPILTACFFIVRLAQLFPEESFTSYSAKLVGRWMSTILTLIFVVYWILNGGRVVRVFADLLKTTLLFRTPIELIILSFLVLAAYLARAGIEPQARFAGMAVIISIPLGVLLVLATYTDWDFTNLLPLLERGVRPVAMASAKSLGQLEGLESLLFLLAFVQKPKKALPYCLGAVTLVNTLVLIITTTALLDFGAVETARLAFPGINLIQSVEIPGGFLERLGSLYVAIWILILFPTTVAFLYLPSIALAQVFRLSDARSFVPLLIPFVYATALIPANRGQVLAFAEALTPINIILIGILPIILYLVAHLRGFAKEKKQK